MFLCEECEQGFQNVPELIEKLKKAEERLETLEKNMNNLKNEASIGAECEEFISELLERQKRASNIMIANIREAAAERGVDRKEEDTNSVKDLLKDYNVDLNGIKVFRVGKPVEGRARLMKVIMNNSEDALRVLRSKRNKGNTIKIFSDQTIKQREYYLSVKNKLDAIHAEGDTSKIIKYINNKPTIVSKTQNFRNH